MSGVTGLSSSIASPPWPGQIPRSQLKLQMKLRVRTTPLTVRTGRCRFASRLCGSEGGRLGIVVRSQKEVKEGKQLEKVEKKSSESWASSIQRVSTVTRIFMATLVWSCLFFWVSITNSEAGGGRPGRRGPRK